MVESRTARMRLVQWSSGTDSPQRVDFNETFLNIETLAAIDQQGAYNDRPAPSKKGMYYFATDQGTLYRSDGLSWAVVGASVFSQFVRPARTDDVAQTVQGLPSQTADLKRVISGAGVLYQRVRSNGDLIHGPLRVSQVARTATSTETVPTDSATTVDNNSSSMWGLSLLNTTGNTVGFFRAVRGGSTVFSVGPTGVVTAPTVALTSAPTSGNHATTKTYVDELVGSTVYPLDGPRLSGLLPVSRGGTGRTTAPTNGYLRGNSSGVYETMTPAGVRNDIDAATSGHGHALTDENITGTLPINQGGTGATTEASARSALAVPSTSIAISAGAGLSGGGTLAASRTLQVVFEGSGSKTTAARSDHGHALTDANVTGVLPVVQGGTGRSTLDAGSFLQGNGTELPNLRTPAQVLSDIGAATSGHGHDLTDANITGTLQIAQGGTGATTATTGLGNLGGLPRDIEVLPAKQNINTWTTTGKWIPAAWSQVSPSNGYPVSDSVAMLEHTQVAAGYAVQVVTIPFESKQFRRTNNNGTWQKWELVPSTPYRADPGNMNGWIVHTNGISVVPHSDGTLGCSMEVALARNAFSFTQGSSYIAHGNFIPSSLRPSHVGGQYFWCQIATASGIGYIRWSDGQFSCRTDSADVSQVINTGSRISFNLNWIV